MNQDIDSLLQAWEFDPQANVRKIWGDEGVQKLQVRIDQGAFQGILQMNLEGRPDGKRPYDFDFALDYYHHSLEKHREEHGGNETGFSLDRKACEELFDESGRVYGRYAFLLQLKDYERVVRDTERNMGLFRFINTYAREEEDRMNLEKWWPYILRIHTTARAMLCCQRQDFDQAFSIVQEAREKIDDLPEMEAEEFVLERERSREALGQLEEELQRSKPLSREEQLEQELEEVIERDEFEKAAVIRDELKKLRDQDVAQRERE